MVIVYNLQLLCVSGLVAQRKTSNLFKCALDGVIRRAN